MQTPSEFLRSHSHTQFLSRLLFIVGTLFILLNITCIPAYAASDTKEVDRQNSEETITTKPENLVEYAAQKIDNLKEEGVTVSAVAAEVISPLEKRQCSKLVCYREILVSLVIITKAIIP